MDESEISHRTMAAETAAKIGKTAVIGLGVGTAAFFATPFVVSAGLGAFGFGSSGVAAGSAAAGLQAGIGNVVVGSAFATAQSVGAAGLATSTVAAVSSVVGSIAGGIAAFTTKWNRGPVHEDKAPTNPEANQRKETHPAKVLPDDSQCAGRLTTGNMDTDNTLNLREGRANSMTDKLLVSQICPAAKL